LDEIPANLADGYLKNIVGFRLHELTFKSCFRLNQRKGDMESLAESLRATGDAACDKLATLVLQPPTARTE
jgi:predicted FMN-binding regulatory protein PaiB